jgi:NAD+ synthase
VTRAVAADPFADFESFDAERELERISDFVRDAIGRMLRRRGAVVGVSGGVDSSVVLAVCAHSLGADKVLALTTPERESAPDTLELSRLAADSVGAQALVEDLTPVLEAFGFYRTRDEVVARLVPDYTPEWRMKITLPPVQDESHLRIFQLVAESPTGEQLTRRLPAEEYRTLVAATNFKQRARKTLEYFHADRLGYAVVGTPNRLEYDQGFFVKNGDGAADLKPIAHLFKTQVYRLAELLGVDERIRTRTPTTDTYSLEQTQEEFFFSVPLATLDVCLYARDRGISAASVAGRCGLQEEQVERVFGDIDAKRRAASYLHLQPLVLEDAL